MNTGWGWSDRSSIEDEDFFGHDAAAQSHGWGVGARTLACRLAASSAKILMLRNSRMGSRVAI
jgi:hypothetical protein